MTDTNWIREFPGLAGLETGIRERVAASSSVVRLPEGTQIFGPGKAPEHFLLLIEGVVRVQQVSEGGREIVLYRVNAGESCALTTACLLAFDEYQAEGVAETNVVAAALARAAFDDLMSASKEFRRFVFTAFSSRITDLLKIIDEVAFSRVDIRLAQKLLGMPSAASRISVTHQQLAAELGTAREVVSRQMQEFARRGWVTGARGEIEIVNKAALTDLAGSH